MLLETIIASLVPVGIESIKKYIDKKTGVVPVTVEDQVKLDNSEIERLKAIASLDNPFGTPSQWVIDLRSSSRYIAALLVILGGIFTFYIPDLPKEAYSLAADAVSIVFGFLFGQRIIARK